jgi:hypothetical protein
MVWDGEGGQLVLYLYWWLSLGRMHACEQVNLKEA